MARKHEAMARIIVAMEEKPEQWFYGLDIIDATGLRAERMYAALSQLEQDGWLEACWDEGVHPRRSYRLIRSSRDAS